LERLVSKAEGRRLKEEGRRTKAEILRDIRFAVRSLMRSPGFAAAALITLALGIGANTAIFTIVNALLLRPLPYADPDRLAIVWEHNIPRQKPDNVVSPGNYIHWREQAQSFERLAGASPSFRGTISGGGREAEELPLQFVSADLLPMLGVRPALGRWFRPEEDRPPRTVVIISHRLWLRRFDGDPTIVNQPITVNGESVSVVGVMPEGFSFIFRDIDLWVPLALPETARTPRGRWMIVLGRLRSGATIAQAQTEMDAIHGRLTRAFPEFNTGWKTTVVPLGEQLSGPVRPALLTLLAAVGFVLLIACANVANLMLARSTSRRREIAVRCALGAPRGRVVGGLLTESLILSMAGGAVGLGLAWWGVHALRSVVATTIPLFPRLDEIAMNSGILVFALTLSAVTGVVFGIAPALLVSRMDLQESLREGGRSGTARESVARASLVVAQVALALVLLAGSGLLVRSFARLLSVDPGFSAENALTAKVTVSGDAYRDDARKRAFFNELIDRVGRAGGVKAVGGVSFLPMNGLGAATSFEIVGREKPPLGNDPVADVRVVGGDYFEAMQIPLLAGRTFEPREQREKANAVIVNATLARQYWPGESPVGKKIVVSWDTSDPDEIVGVVGDERVADLATAVRPIVYWPQGRFAYPWATLVVRTEGNPLNAAAIIRREVHAIDRGVPVADVRPLEDVVARSVAQRRLTMLLLAAFAAVALTLAVVGIYGVMAYGVAQRTREIGVRLALGASPRDVLVLVMRRAMLLAAIGVAIGSTAAYLLTRYMTSLLFETAPGDPFTLAIVAGVLLLAAALAGYVPGRSATRVDPLIALRAE
jgi:putative ABC transport system permease protein